MLSGHPHIERLYTRESLVKGRKIQKLIVETNLRLPPSGEYRDVQEIQDLQKFLESLTRYGLADFNDVEIRARQNDQASCVPTQQAACQ